MVSRPQTLPPPPTPAFTGATLDRAAKLRASPRAIESLTADPTARAVLSRNDAVLVSADNLALQRHSLHETVQPLLLGVQPLLLGLEAGTPLFGIDLDWLDEAAAEQLIAGGRLMSLRDAGASLAQEEGGLAAYLVALTGWHRLHRFCANCGALTEVVEGGLTRHCPSCGRSHFPRTDPVVIMLVEHEHDGHLLLGRRRGWPAGRYSLLAGFVSAGETPEEAVIREVREESAIEARRPSYVTAQPWPFPASLMLGFTAMSDGGIPRCADGELEDVRWFHREQVRAAARQAADWSISAETPKELLLPPRVSIARSLIEWWLATSDRPE